LVDITVLHTSGNSSGAGNLLTQNLFWSGQQMHEGTTIELI
ncbi:MAG: hypothetical protein ACI91U_001965, partial [Candidatus Poriferisodalaceae bacterium]